MGEPLAIIVGVFLLIFIGASSVQDSDTYQLGEKAMFIIKDCEKDLPRNQKCTIHAVAEEKE